MSTVTQLFILAGFLGAGKTTLLNNCLALLHGHQVGVVINEFGAVGIDRVRIKQDNDVPVVELNNGQIFCSCLAGSFVESISVLLHQQPEYILVESSGLAKPAPLMEIINQIKRQTSAAFVYRGMIAVLDIKTYPVLSQSVYALHEQLKYSDAILMNKVDLVDETTKIKIRRELENKYPQAKIRETSYCQIDPTLLELTPVPPAEGVNPVSPSGRILRLTLRQEKPLTQQALFEFLQQVSPHVQRIKGMLQVENGLVEVDTVGELLKVEPVKKDWLSEATDYYLSLLDAHHGDQAYAVYQAWEKAQGGQ